MVIASYEGGEWVNNPATVPEDLVPSDMEMIAIWSEIPEPDKKLLKQIGQGNVRIHGRVSTRD